MLRAYLRTPYAYVRRQSAHTAAYDTLPPIRLDLKQIQEQSDDVVTNARVRNAPVSSHDVHEIVRLSEQIKSLSRDAQEVRRKQNEISRRHTTNKQGSASSSENPNVNNEGSDLRARLKDLSAQIKEAEDSVQAIALQLPNATHPNSPVGGYNECQVVRTYGVQALDVKTRAVPKPQAHKDHVSACTLLDWLDVESGNRLVGPRWPVLKNEGALLELALTNYALKIALDEGFSPILAPDVVKSAIADRCGFQPRENEAAQTYFVSDSLQRGSDMSLAGTAEIPLAGQYLGQTLDAATLPLKNVALGRAFRAEAGARGRESRGLYRVHQFSKVELFVVCRPEDSDKMLQTLVHTQGKILSQLDLPLRVLHMSTEELGSSAYQKYDIEAWMPGRGSWGELASASNCTDYQSRRLNIQYATMSLAKAEKPKRVPLDNLDIPVPPHLEATALLPDLENRRKITGTKQFVHTLNATAAAIPRLIIALVENGINFEHGTGQLYVQLPAILRRHWLGQSDDVGVKNKLGQYCIRWKQP